MRKFHSLMESFCIILLFICGAVEASIYIFDDDYMRFKVDEFEDRELPFASPIKKLGLKGLIVNADPPDACSSIVRPPTVNFTMDWFVLIAGNFCDYITKIVNAERAGYAAAVIYETNRWNISSTTKDDFVTPNISAVAIRTSTGIIIRENYLFTIDSSYSVLIYPNSRYDFATFLFLFVIALAVVISLAILMKKLDQIRTNRHSRLSSDHLNQLKITTYQGHTYETCAICLEDYKSKDKLRILPCLHGYHVKCIDPWLTRDRRICPVCKQKVVLGGDVESDVESRSESSPLLSNATRSTGNTYNSQSV